MQSVSPPRSASRPSAATRCTGFARGLSAAALALACPHAAAAAEGGLVLVPHPPLLLALILFFVLLIFPVNALVFKPLLRVLDERDARIEGTRAKAAKLEGNAAELLARYEAEVSEAKQSAEGERRAQLDSVRAEAQRETASARGEAEARIEEARRQVAASLDDARATLRSQSQELARQAAAQVLGRTL